MASLKESITHSNVQIDFVYYIPVQNICSEHCAPHCNLGVWPLLKIKMRNKLENPCKVLCMTVIQKDSIKLAFFIIDSDSKVLCLLKSCFQSHVVMYANTTHRGLRCMPSVMVVTASFQVKILFRMHKFIRLVSKPLLKYGMLSFIKNSVEVLVRVP